MIRPLNDNVVLKKEKVEKVTTSGIILSKEKEETEYAIVVAVGSGKKTDDGKVLPLDVKVGDKVLYKSYSPTKVNVCGNEYLIVSEEDILAIVE